MSLFSSSQLALIDALSDGQCYSGNVLGERLGISRAAVWKHIQHLLAHGLPIQCIAKRGYQLHHPMIPLNEQAIRSQLESNVPLHLFTEIDSTNRFLKKTSCDADEMFCLAEMQTQGRGRFGRDWFSPFGENIYFSARYPWQDSLSSLSGLSLIVSLAVCDALQPFIGSEQLQVKWPNDILWQHKKLAGILIEVNAESHGHAQLVIGIGINVNAASTLYPNPGKPWCSLIDIGGSAIDRNRVAASLIKQLSAHFYQFKQKGFSPFRDRWHHLDYLAGKIITVNQINDQIEGQALGVDNSGLLQLRDQTGMLHSLSCGESSLKKIASG